MGHPRIRSILNNDFTPFFKMSVKVNTVVIFTNQKADPPLQAAKVPVAVYGYATVSYDSLTQASSPWALVSVG